MRSLQFPPGGGDEWEPFFAWLPVWVDAYNETEIKNGKMRYRKWGWVQRRWNDNEFGSWSYRP